MPEFQYYEGAQRIQREAVLEVLGSVNLFEHAILFKTPESYLRFCELKSVGKFKKPVVILRRKKFPDLMVKLA